MTKGNIQFTKDNEYYTPKRVVEYFGKFDYDPATCEEKAKEFGIKNYDTIETNGLTKDWTIYKNIWINPPFTEKHKFLEKAYQTYKIAKNKRIVTYDGDNIELGIYKTKERSLEVLDEIQNYILLPNTDNSSYVYNMTEN